MPLAVCIHALPAFCGDCLWVECHLSAGGVYRILIDGGTPETWPGLRDKIAGLPAGSRRIDLAVITHVDSDHIGGMIPLFQEAAALGVEFGDVWFNGLRHLPGDPQESVRSIAEGEALTALLQVQPWNLAFFGAAAATAGHGEIRPDAAAPAPGVPRITLLSPTPRALERLGIVWRETIEGALRGVREEEAGPPEPPAGLEDLAALAAKNTAIDASVPNSTSIAFLLEHRGASCLFAADASPRILGAALTALANSRNGVPELDLLKLPHHGSKANVTAKLLDLCPARHYLISTDGSAHSHPHDVALARAVVCRPGRPRTLWFNYETAVTARWAHRALTNAYGYNAAFPGASGTGARIDLPAKEP